MGLHILSYLEYSDLNRFSVASKGARDLRDGNNFQLERAIFSKIEIFDRKHWNEYWNVEVTGQYDADKIDIKVLKEFLQTYYGKNPIGPGRVCDDCLTPALVPSEIGRKKSTDIDSNANEKYCLSVLGEVAEHPLKGHPAKYAYQSEALKQHGMTPAGPTKLVIKIKGVIARQKPWAEQIKILNKLFTKTGWGAWPILMLFHKILLYLPIMRLQVSVRMVMKLAWRVDGPMVVQLSLFELKKKITLWFQAALERLALLGAPPLPSCLSSTSTSATRTAALGSSGSSKFIGTWKFGP